MNDHRVPVIESHGIAIPKLGLGTWPMKGEECARAVAHALSLGYPAIDTATAYDNEAAVGEGLRAAGLAREDVFVTTKVWYPNIGGGALQTSAEQSLRRLGLDRVDLLLIHWPNRSIPLAESIAALCEVQRRGLARAVGVSNFPVGLLTEALRLATVPLVANQCEYHPLLEQGPVLAACRKAGMVFISYSPLGRGDLGARAPISAAATAHGKSAAQVVLRWHIQQEGVVAIPKSATPARIAENLDIFDFALSPAEMRAISALGTRAGRMVAPAWSPDWD